MKYRCTFRKDTHMHLTVLMVEASDPYEAAVRAARRNADLDFRTVEVWDGPERLLIWRRPAGEAPRGLLRQPERRRQARV
jgi:hypothetical protein